MDKINLENLFNKGIELHTITNTAYPLTPTSLKEYAIKDDNRIEKLLAQEYNDIDKLSLYVHIPFCKTRCKFCEYVVVSGSESELKDEYTNALLKEIDLYGQIIDKKKHITGFDIGGGTPTELGFDRIKKIVYKLSNIFNLNKDQIWSIETTPFNAINKSKELKEFYNIGFERISMGIQTLNPEVLKRMQREGNKPLYQNAVDNIRRAGYTRLNIDLMYGFKDQSIEDFKTTVKYTISLYPEYITLYEMRYKLTQIAKDASDVTLDKLNQQYEAAYEILTQNGYTANYGKNTFSRIGNNYGTSDYLTSRVINATPYLGLGAGAQSFGLNYLTYNQGAATKSIAKYIEYVNNNRFPIQDIYNLPEEEVMAKAISVMFYFSFIDINNFRERFGKNFTETFKEEINYLITRNLAEIKNEMLFITRKGVKQMNGIIPMFYSGRSKNELMNMNLEKLFK